MSIEDGFICYIPRRFRQSSLKTLEWINRVIAEYEATGYRLSLRQLFYQGVVRNRIPNNEQSYSRLSELLGFARNAGVISWHAIEDRSRSLQGWPTHGSPAEAIRDARNTYKRELWATQPCRLEVWVEKDALLGVVE